MDPIALRARRRDAYESARGEVIERVPANARRVLDLGCASGALGVALKRRQSAEVVGVELMPEYAADADLVLDRVLCGDVAEQLRRDDLGTFDCVIAADVLEHLVDPWETLHRVAELTDPGGTLIISLPNVQYLKTFLVLARGRWPRDDAGLFDRTHLRWFTFADAGDMLVEAGYEVTSVEGRYWFSGRVTSPLARWLGERGLRTFLAGQMLFTARKPVSESAHRG